MPESWFEKDYEELQEINLQMHRKQYPLKSYAVHLACAGLSNAAFRKEKCILAWITMNIDHGRHGIDT